ncbi:hypothetical protein D210916BOD24_01360 [Alteromonas sp. D210916BOD_24]|uniref:hypothetical protein n=1 Tax=Alteromonas sp. D210916BOD_24 TaxID=3157618 RepID=UPI00399CEAFF
MAIENSTNSIFKARVNSSSTTNALSATTAPLDSTMAISTGDITVDNAAKSGQSLPGLFASLLSAYTPQSATSENSSTETVTDVVSSSDTLQTSLTLMENGNPLSDSALSLLQSELLSALHQSVFQSASGTGNTSNNVDSQNSGNASLAVTTEQPTEVSGVFDTLYTQAFGKDGLSLQDGFDALNIVNHLPIVSDLYEVTTASQTSPVSSLAGSLIYGGLGGLLYNAVDLSIEGMTGKNISNQMWSLGGSLISSVFTSQPETQSSTQPDLSTTSISDGMETSAAHAAYQFVQRAF